MSHRKNMERAARGEIHRWGSSLHIEPGQEIALKEQRLMMLTCGKCGGTFSESLASEHLKQCQPAGAKCGRCGKTYPPHQFVDHIKNCKGKLQEAFYANTRVP
jgi:uncharacterized OB-fold protein